MFQTWDPQQSLVSSNRDDHFRTPSQLKVCLPAEYLLKVMMFRTYDMSFFQLWQALNNALSCWSQWPAQDNLSIKSLPTNWSIPYDDERRDLRHELSPGMTDPPHSLVSATIGSFWSYPGHPLIYKSIYLLNIPSQQRKRKTNVSRDKPPTNTTHTTYTWPRTMIPRRTTTYN